MTYAFYLRERAGDCIRLAVDDPERTDTEDLIDLAQDYFCWASSWETQVEEHGSAPTPFIDDDPPEPPARGLMRLFRSPF